ATRSSADLTTAVPSADSSRGRRHFAAVGAAEKRPCPRAFLARQRSVRCSTHLTANIWSVIALRRENSTPHDATAGAQRGSLPRASSSRAKRRVSSRQLSSFERDTGFEPATFSLGS